MFEPEGYNLAEYQAALEPFKNGRLTIYPVFLPYSRHTIKREGTQGRFASLLQSANTYPASFHPASYFGYDDINPLIIKRKTDNLENSNLPIHWTFNYVAILLYIPSSIASLADNDLIYSLKFCYHSYPYFLSGLRVFAVTVDICKKTSYVTFALMDVIRSDYIYTRTYGPFQLYDPRYFHPLNKILTGHDCFLTLLLYLQPYTDPGTNSTIYYSLHVVEAIDILDRFPNDDQLKIHYSNYAADSTYPEDYVELLINTSNAIVIMPFNKQSFFLPSQYSLNVTVPNNAFVRMICIGRLPARDKKLMRSIAKQMKLWHDNILSCPDRAILLPASKFKLSGRASSSINPLIQADNQYGVYGNLLTSISANSSGDQGSLSVFSGLGVPTTVVQRNLVVSRCYSNLMIGQLTAASVDSLNYFDVGILAGSVSDANVINWLVLIPRINAETSTVASSTTAFVILATGLPAILTEASILGYTPVILQTVLRTPIESEGQANLILTFVGDSATETASPSSLRAALTSVINCYSSSAISTKVDVINQIDSELSSSVVVSAWAGLLALLRGAAATSSWSQVFNNLLVTLTDFAYTEPAIGGATASSISSEQAIYETGTVTDSRVCPILFSYPFIGYSLTGGVAVPDDLIAFLSATLATAHKFELTHVQDKVTGYGIAVNSSINDATFNLLATILSRLISSSSASSRGSLYQTIQTIATNCLVIHTETAAQTKLYSYQITSSDIVGSAVAAATPRAYLLTESDVQNKVSTPATIYALPHTISYAFGEIPFIIGGHAETVAGTLSFVSSRLESSFRFDVGTIASVFANSVIRPVGLSLCNSVTFSTTTQSIRLDGRTIIVSAAYTDGIDTVITDDRPSITAVVGTCIIFTSKTTVALAIPTVGRSVDHTKTFFIPTY